MRMSRSAAGAGVLVFTTLLPTMGRVQAFQLRTPAPQVTAADAAWQINGEPITVEGLVFFPTHAMRFFDGSVMAQIGVYEGVPVYADTTLEPYSVVYVPVGNGRMLEYEHPRTGDLAGTTGSRTPTFPVPLPSTLPQPQADALSGAAIRARTPDVVVAPGSAPAPAAAPESPLPPGNGIWIPFRGARWYSAGGAVPFSAVRFEGIGSYRGFTVYREMDGASDVIWIRSATNGPIAPYRRRER